MHAEMLRGPRVSRPTGIGQAAFAAGVLRTRGFGAGLWILEPAERSYATAAAWAQRADVLVPPHTVNVFEGTIADNVNPILGYFMTFIIYGMVFNTASHQLLSGLSTLLTANSLAWDQSTSDSSCSPVAAPPLTSNLRVFPCVE